MVEPRKGTTKEFWSLDPAESSPVPISIDGLSCPICQNPLIEVEVVPLVTYEYSLESVKQALAAMREPKE